MTTYYKTLIDGKSFHGGVFEYSLPKLKKDGTYTPGKWHKHKGPLEMCCSGFHVTSEPVNWWCKAAKCYEVEYRGKALIDPNSDKICVAEVRLIREVPPEEVQIFYSGSHIVNSGTCLLYNDASAELWNSSSAKLCDSSSAELYQSSSAKLCDSSSAELYESSSARLCDSSSAELYQSSSATLYDSSRATLYGSSRAELYESSSARLCDSSRAELYQSSSAELYGSSSAILRDSSRATLYGSSSATKTPYSAAKVTPNDNAIEIDRTTHPPTVRGNFQTEETK